MKLKHLGLAVAAMAAATIGNAALAQKKYDPGATDKEIKVGNIMPYCGPASAYGAIGKAIGAYFNKVNAEGGINGRMVKFVSLDDGYNPAKTVEQARKLVEEDEVLLLFQPLGTPPNSAIHKYMNSKKVPQLFVATGATKWGDPKGLSLDDGLAAQLPDRGEDLRGAHPRDQAERQDRGAVPERRLRQGLPEGLRGRARRQGQDDDRLQAVVRGDRSDRRQPDGVAEGVGRRHVLQHHHAQVRGAGDQEGRGDRLETGALPEQRVERGWGRC